MTREKRTEPTFPPVRVCVRLALQQVSKETLNKVLRVGGTVPTPTREGVKRRPIIAAKPSQCCVRRPVVGGASLDDAPVSSGKSCTALPECARNPFHGVKNRRKQSRMTRH